MPFHKQSQTKRKNQTTNKKKNQNQAYRRVDLDLDVPRGQHLFKFYLGLGLCEWGDDFWAKEE